MDNIVDILVKDMKVSNVSFDNLVDTYKDKFNLINFEDLEKEYGSNVAVSFLYHFFENYINVNKKYLECDDILNTMDITICPKYLLLAIVKYTKPYKKSLQNRTNFLKRVRLSFGDSAKLLKKHLI